MRITQMLNFLFKFPIQEGQNTNRIFSALVGLSELLLVAHHLVIVVLPIALLSKIDIHWLDSITASPMSESGLSALMGSFDAILPSLSRRTQYFAVSYAQASQPYGSCNRVWIGLYFRSWGR